MTRLPVDVSEENECLTTGGRLGSGELDRRVTTREDPRVYKNPDVQVYW